MYKTAKALHAELSSDQRVVPLSQGDILDACPLVFWADETHEVAEGDKPQCPVSCHHPDPGVRSGQRQVGSGHRRCGARCSPSRANRPRQGKVHSRNVRKGQVYGWYFLPAHASCPGFPESLVDLRDLHTVPRPLLEGLRDRDKLVCRLTTPYREHLAQHLSVTYSRIGLPEPYGTAD